jgi:hypothetical protein
MTSFRTIRTARPDVTARRIRPHVLRRDGIIEPPSDLPRHDRYRSAIQAGWRPLV